MKKILFFLLLSLIILGTAAGYFYSHKNSFISEKLRVGLESLTGTSVEMDTLEVKSVHGISEWEVTVKKIKIKNPESFQEPVMVFLKDVKILLEPLPLFQGKWRIHELSAFLYKANFQTNEAGLLNAAQLPSLKILMGSGPAAAAVPADVFRADRVELKYGTVYRLDFHAKPAEKSAHALGGKVDVYMRVNNPHLLVQAPVFTYITQLNQGSFGLPRGKLQESIKQYVGQ